MHAISIMEPWASAIAFHGKDIENRSWKPPHKVIGQIVAIHASVGLAELRGFREMVALGMRTPAHHRPLIELASLGNSDNTRGRIIATAMLAGWIRGDASDVDDWASTGKERHAERVRAAFDSVWRFGPYGHVLVDVVPVSPACRDAIGTIRGALSYWDVPDDIAAKLMGDREVPQW